MNDSSQHYVQPLCTKEVAIKLGKQAQGFADFQNKPPQMRSEAIGKKSVSVLKKYGQTFSTLRYVTCE